MTAMKISENGLKFIARREGVRRKAYLCQAGVWTIGVGHTAGFRDGRYTPESVIDDEEIAALLLVDSSDAARAVNAFVTAPLTQAQFDALVSFTFTVGRNAFKSSTALVRLNRGDYVGAAEALTWWDKADLNRDGITEKSERSEGLANRRKMEQRLFLTGDYGA